MTKAELYRLIQETDKKHQRNKEKRFLCSLGIYILLYLLYFHCRGEISTFPEFIDMGILALFLSVINLFISFFIIKHLLEASSDEDKQLKYLEDKLRELDDAK